MYVEIPRKDLLPALKMANSVIEIKKTVLEIPFDNIIVLKTTAIGILWITIPINNELLWLKWLCPSLISAIPSIKECKHRLIKMA